MRLQFLLATAVLAVAPASADTIPGGFSLTSLPFPTQSATVTLSNGELVTFDGTLVQHWTDGGLLIQTLADLSPLVTCDAFAAPACVFGGALAAAPDDSHVLVGESSNGEVFRVDVSDGTVTPLGNFFFNFDAAFESASMAVVSAAVGGFGTPNELWRLDTSTGDSSRLAVLPGASGPVAFDGSGNLYYATVDDRFPPTPGSTDVLLFTAAQVTSGVELLDGDAIVFASGFEPGSSLATGPEPFQVFLAENDFSTGVNRVWQVGTSPATSFLLVDGDSGNNITGLEFDGGGRGAIFQGYQPAEGGTLRYRTTNFFSVFERNAVAPARPAGSISGPGLSGPGIVTFQVDGAAPFAAWFLVFGPSALASPTEQVLSLPGLPPIFTVLDQATFGFLPFLLPTDANGSGSFSFFNPGGLQNSLVLQGLVTGPTGFVLGSSTSANF